MPVKAVRPITPALPPEPPDLDEPQPAPEAAVVEYADEDDPATVERLIAHARMVLARRRAAKAGRR